MALQHFKLPDIGEGIDAAELIEWKVAPGQQVREDDALADVETDKAVVALPCPGTGVVLELRYQPGDRIPVGEVMVVLELADDTGGAGTSPAVVAPAPDVHAPAAAAAPRGPGETTEVAAQSSGGGAGTTTTAAGRPLASPATRRLARELAVDLSTVRGTGPAGRIEREDVERAAAAGAPQPGAQQPAGVRRDAGQPQVVQMTGMRRTIAQRMSQAWSEVPRIIDYREVDATAILAARAALADLSAKKGESPLSLLPLVVKIACVALRENPFVNSSVDMAAGSITLHPACHIGIATSTPDGLVVPVVRDADSKTVREIAAESQELVEAARARRLTPQQMSGATFTVNNFGPLGIWLGTPIVVPPQVANLGIGRLEKRPVVVDDQVVVRPVLPLSVSGDHRVLDGDTLAAFVSRVVALIEQPALMLEAVR